MVRFKKRWLLIELIPQPIGEKLHPNITYDALNMLDSKQIWSALRDCALLNFGDVGWGSISSSLSVKYFSPTTRLCIIRVARDHYRTAWAAVTLIKTIRDQPVIPQVIHISGTIKHTQLAAIAHNREVIARLMARTELRERLDEALENSVREIEALQE